MVPGYPNQYFKIQLLFILRNKVIDSKCDKTEIQKSFGEM